MKRSAFKDISRVGLWAAFFALPVTSQNAFAVEDAQNFYLLGQRASLAGVTPPPGLYFQDPVYFYDGSAGANHDFEFGGHVVAGVVSNAELSVPTVVWVTPATILGGNLGFSLSEPFGHIGVLGQCDADRTVGISESRRFGERQHDDGRRPDSRSVHRLGFRQFSLAGRRDGERADR